MITIRNLKIFIYPEISQILIAIIKKDLRGHNVSIGKKIYLNQITGWLNRYNKKRLK